MMNNAVSHNVGGGCWFYSVVFVFTQILTFFFFLCVFHLTHIKLWLYIFQCKLLWELSVIHTIIKDDFEELFGKYQCKIKFSTVLFIHKRNPQYHCDQSYCIMWLWHQFKSKRKHKTGAADTLIQLLVICFYWW